MKKRLSHGLSAAVFSVALMAGAGFTSYAAEAAEASGPAAEVSAFSEETSDPVKTAEGSFLGEFDITAYCGCQKCSKGNLLTYSGTAPQADHTISANLSVFPIGTQLRIGDTVYTVEDTGSGVGRNHLDIYFDSHEDALDYGRQTEKVYAVE